MKDSVTQQTGERINQVNAGGSHLKAYRAFVQLYICLVSTEIVSSSPLIVCLSLTLIK